MKIKLKQELYSSPEAKVIEVNARQVLCGSGDSLNPYSGNSWND